VWSAAEEVAAILNCEPPEGQETDMSRINGDKARFNRRRRQKIRRRLSNLKMLKDLEQKRLIPPPADASPANPAGQD
jgi:hypothetical protein